jgi:hypothetical protein
MDPARRELVKRGLLAIATLPAAQLLTGALSACGPSQEGSAPTAPQPAPAPPVAPPAPKPPTPAPAGAGAQAPAGARLVTEIPAAAPLVSSLQYVNQSAQPEQRCANCQLFTATENDLGRCQLFPEGLVRSAGWCMSWTAKVPGPGLSN